LETLALAYHMTGNLDMAIETQRRAIPLAQASGLYDQEKMKATLRDYLLQQGDLLGAVNASWEGLATNIGDWLIPGTTPETSLVLRSESLIKEGRYNEAVQTLESCLTMRRKTLPQGHWLIAETMSQLGRALALTGAFDEAEPLLLDAYAALKKSSGLTQTPKREAIQRIVQFYIAWGRTEQAAAWRRQLEEKDGITNTDL
jgi:tetratricopeptide (TPR) repeat protein